MGAVIDFGIKKYWRLASTSQIANFVWFYKFEKGLSSLEERPFTLDDEPAFIGLWAEVRRRAKCGDKDMITLWTGGEPDWKVHISE